MSAGGVTFDFPNNYEIVVYPPDSTGQCGLKITEGANVVVSLTYKDPTDWDLHVDLPALKLGDKLTINTLNVDIGDGTVDPLS